MTTQDISTEDAAPAEPELARLSELTDLVTPMAIRVAATLRLADLLADGPASLDQLAGWAGADPNALDRLLGHLAGRGVFQQPQPGCFALTDLARPLADDHTAGWRAWLDLDGPIGRSDMAFAHMLDSVRTGEPAYARMFDRPMWDDFDAHPHLRASFDALMSAQLADVAAEVADAYDWTDVEHVVDVGGGDGTQLAEILRTNPALRGTLVEQPATANAARDNLAGRELADRCAVVAGSFFEELPAGAEIYLLSVILHDWNDDSAARILRRCARAAGQHGRVVIVEHLAGTADPPSLTALDLRMLVTLGGRERTATDFRALADAAGLTVARVIATRGPRSLIECVPA